MESLFFYWFFQPEDFDEENNLILDISTGRLRHKWFPKTKSAAIRYLREHEDAEGLRALSNNHLIVKIFLPEENLEDKYPKSIPEGFEKSSVVLKTPLKAILPMQNRREEQDIYYGKPDLIFAKSMELSGISMGLYSDEDVLKLQVMEVTTSEIRMENGSPVINGVLDPRMGSTTTDKVCPTCNLNHDPSNSRASKVCGGHFGYIDLPEPIPKILYLGHSRGRGDNSKPIMHTLNSVCHSCSRILLPDDMLSALDPVIRQEMQVGGRTNISYRKIRDIISTNIKKYVKAHGRNCPHCDEFSPKFTFYYKSNTFVLNQPVNGIKSMNFLSIRTIFESIPDEDCHLLGMDYTLSRPENLFVRRMLVAPNTARPGKRRQSGEMDDDDLTKLYAQVAYASNTVREIRNRGGKISSEEYNIKRLFEAVSRITNNQLDYIGSGGSSLRFGYEGSVALASYQGIINRFHGKKGRFRANLQSKYVENMAYSIISPDPYLSIDEVGVPLSVCKDIGYPVLVTKENMKECLQYVENTLNGKYPGANEIYKDGHPSQRIESSRKIWSAKTEEERETQLENITNLLEPGMYLRRDLVRGDIGIFNRAPSLHRQSVLAFRVRPVNTKSLRMNPTVCIPFNADYDGDAMKLHFVQSEEAKKEAIELMLLTKNIIHARYGKLTVATDQDQTSGLYLLTHTDKNRAGEWDGTLGFTDEGIPYVSKTMAISCFSTVYSEIRGAEIAYRNIESLPKPDYKSPPIYEKLSEMEESKGIKPKISLKSQDCYTGRSLFNHLFTVLDAEYVSAQFEGNTPLTNEEGDVIYIDGEKQYETVFIQNGKLITGTIEKDAFGEGGASIAPSFIYHEGYEKGTEKLNEFIEMATRLGFAGHFTIGYTMGIDDVSAKGVENEIEREYNLCVERILSLENAFADGNLSQYAERKTPKRRVYADADPLNYMEEEIDGMVTQFENKILEPIENKQGSGNAMQVAIRSRARGKDENVRQMAGSYGLVRVGGERITYGINSYRTLPHYPLQKIEYDYDAGELVDVNRKMLPLLHPKHRGLVESSYVKGMEPHEYWLTSTAGRRSTAESGQGQIAKSGYLERKMVKALESCVVNSRRQVVNLRTGRIISPIVGEDWLSPYHIRGSDDDGTIITLQPLLFDFDCKHDVPLALPCDRCQPTKISKTFDNLMEKEFYISNRVKKEMSYIISLRECSIPVVRKIAKRLVEYYENSFCRVGEAIGATAGSCIGEPATQEALRTFHFAGKMSTQSSIDRLKQILESPMNPPTKVPETIIRLKESETLEKAERIRSLLTEVSGDQLIKYIAYDVKNESLIINFDTKAFEVYRVSTGIAFNQLVTSLESAKQLFKFQILDNQIRFDEPLVIKISGTNYNSLVYAKEIIMNTSFNGIKDVIDIEVFSKEDDKFGRHGLRILSASQVLLETLGESLEKDIDLDLIETNNHLWIYKKYGLEAALFNIYNELDNQMNGKGGIGEYDLRYIRTIIDLMGEKGEVSSLAPSGLSVMDNPSFLGAASLQNISDVLMSSSTMGNVDQLQGIAESIVAGVTPKIGNFAPE